MTFQSQTEILILKSQTASKDENKKKIEREKAFTIMTIRSIDIEAIYHLNNNQGTLENAFKDFVSMNPCLQIFNVSWPKFPNYLLKHLVDTCDDDSRE